MPQAGTKKVVIHGQDIFLPEEDARIVELLEGGCALQQRVEATEHELEGIKAELVSIAERRRGDDGKMTVHLNSPTGQIATVVWSTEKKIDVSKADELKGRLGELWEKVFSVRTSYSLAKTWNTLKEKLPKEISAAIAKAILVAERRPSVKLIDVGS